MKVTKKHKLYFRTPGSESVRRLDKTSPLLYTFMLEYFLEGEGSKEHAELNKDVKKWQDYKPVKVPVPEHLEEEMKKITKRKSLVVSYNTSWLPLCELYYL